MSNPELLETIRERSEGKCSKILENSLEEADAILKKAAKTSEDLRNQARLKVQKEADSIRERKYNYISFRMNARRYELKSSAIKNIWHDSEEIIGKIEQSDTYKEILEQLFFECLSCIPDNAIVRVSPADAETVMTCIVRSKRPLFLKEDPDVHGGIEFHWSEGKIILKNTLSHRLERLKAEGNIDISSLIFVSGEGQSG